MKASDYKLSNNITINGQSEEFTVISKIMDELVPKLDKQVWKWMDDLEYHNFCPEFKHKQSNKTSTVSGLHANISYF